MSSTDKNIRFWPIMIAIFVGTFVCVLASTTINIALPILGDEFNAELGTVQWTLTGFLLATGTLAPTVGYLGEKISYKYLFLYSLIGFTVFSALCAMAGNIHSLIAFRIMQGASCGLIIPATMAIIFQIIPKEKQAFAISLWGLSASLAPAFGPTISGWLLQSFAWQWLFIMNIPVGIIAIFLVMKFIPYYRLSVPKRFDFLGFITVIIGSASLLLAFGQGHSWGWESIKVVGLFIVGIISLILFIVRELTTKTPLLNIRVFSNGRYTLSLIITNILTISLYAGTLLAPVFLQKVQGITAMETGLLLLPSSFVMALVMPIAGKLYSRVGPRLLMSVGVVFLALGTLMLSLISIDISHMYIVLMMTIRNIGVALIMIPASNAAMELIPKELSGHASSIMNWTRNVMGSFAIAIFTSLLATRTLSYGTELAKEGYTNKFHISQIAFTMSINDVFFITAIISIIALPLALMVTKAKKPDINVSSTSEPKPVKNAV
ncbi:DHA2 family efflux MFS transporter permease subunit [Paenibacillus glycanilyticus]|uniref:DHA2 family efflux MFS transporter permease subunit n=1 Tax=Paenibacillus glycanilyticus TaxID=126569 RepID=UPI00203A505A|nr:DHA2 family efflux MFS transporter permease subunit [Paenibacillus glycanilyticus]MCM3629112.1 DHA2 family efflux MFS transporter permease subunit [Paenibacillus glycanilyticus]